MNAKRFGELLGEMVPLSGHDVAEILEDQPASGRRFGEVALAWGLCRPEHVWRAWCGQLGARTPEVDLPSVGVDAQALAHVPRHVATRFRVIPLRCVRGELVLAADPGGLAWAESELPALLRKKVRFVLADSADIGQAMRAYYPPPAARCEAD